MNFYKHYIGDYQRDTGHLSLAEHGAYRLMLDAFYATGKPLPADRKTLYRLLRAATPVERKAIDSVSAQFWEMLSSGLINRRAAVEIEKAGKQAEINRQIAVEREKRKRQRQDGMSALSPCINTGMEEIIGDGALSDPVHESGKVFEVYRVNNTHIVSPMQPFSRTNRATDEAPFVPLQEGKEGGLPREPIHNHNQNHSHNQNTERCGYLATTGSDEGGFCGNKAYGADEKVTGEVPGFFSEKMQADAVSVDSGDVDGGGSPGETEHEEGLATSASHGREQGKLKEVSVSLAKAMQEVGIMASDGDPRLMALARQGVDVGTVMAACSEAKRARPDERIGMAYVVKIVERWARDASAIAARGARAHGRVCVHEHRKRTLDELTGRFPEEVPSLSGMPFTLDGSVRVMGRDENPE